MDKELPKSELHNMIANVHIGTNESFLPGINVQKASVMFRDTIDLDELADRAKKDGTPYSKESLTGCFRTMINEIYKATEAGFNVDFGLARTELTVNGTFDNAHAKFDPECHTLVPCLRPSPRLKQCVKRLPVENLGPIKDFKVPRPDYISRLIRPYNPQTDGKIDKLAPGQPPHVSIYGYNLKLMGDLLGVRITISCLETGESYSVSPDELIVNSRSRLCFTPKIPFTPGEWEALIATQFTPTYHLYKQLRYGTLAFTVADEPQTSEA